MDASPLSQSLSSSRGRSNPNPPSRLSQIACSVKGGGGGREAVAPPGLSLDLVVPTPTTPSSLNSSTSSLPPQELLLLLSPSPSKRTRTRLVDRLEVAEDPGVDPPGGSRKRSKSKAAQMGCNASPRGGSRRLRRRAEVESREERDLALAGLMEDIGKMKRRKQGVRAKKEKLPLVVPSVAPSTPVIQKVVEDAGVGNLDAIGAAAYDLIIWKDVAKTSLWFGFGFLFFFSSCFAKGINFSIFSGISQIGLLFLGASFISNTLCQRNDGEQPRYNFKLTDEDILRVGRLILPAANFAISKTREIFSGEPSMTLKVIPFLILGAEYGHLLTLRRLFATGFFVSFTVPKLYSTYSYQIDQKVEGTKCRVLEAWGACTHKKIVAASAITAFWNLSSIKTRLFTAFISLVILRCSRQHLLPKPDDLETAEAEEDEQLRKALVVISAPVTASPPPTR